MAEFLSAWLPGWLPGWLASWPVFGGLFAILLVALALWRRRSQREGADSERIKQLKAKADALDQTARNWADRPRDGGDLADRLRQRAADKRRHT